MHIQYRCHLVSEAVLKVISLEDAGGIGAWEAQKGREGRSRQRVQLRQRYRDVKRTCVVKIKEQVKGGEAGCEPVR